MTEQTQPSGFTCECGTFHIFGVYVATHWRECLVHTCDVCKAEHDVQCGVVTLIKPRKIKENEKSDAQ
jgi:hypothetical protein